MVTTGTPKLSKANASVFPRPLKFQCHDFGITFKYNCEVKHNKANKFL